MKRLFTIFVASFVTMLAVVMVGHTPELAHAFSGHGAGTGSKPYLITNCTQLQEVRNDLTASYELVNDIDCSATSTWNSGAGFLPIGDSLSTSFTGNFDGNGFEVKNLYINTSIYNNVGLFGYINGGGIEDLGVVNPDITGRAAVGGMVGVFYDGRIIESFVQGGSVTGLEGATGGLIGNATFTEITNTYSSAAVDSVADAGGLIGTSSSISLTASFWDTETSGQASSSGGTGKTTSQMKTQSTFSDAGWYFDGVWAINGSTNNGYPYLENAYGTDDYNGDGIPDDAQTNISSYVDSTTGKRVLIDVGENCEITTDDVLSESDFVVQDPNWNYNNGLFDFAGDCGTPGFTTSVTLMYYDVDEANATFRKYNDNTAVYSTVSSATISVEVINGKTVTVVRYDITDGGELDVDGEENGQFNDPAGLATSLNTVVANADSAQLAQTGVNQNALLALATLIFYAGLIAVIRACGFIHALNNQTD